MMGREGGRVEWFVWIDNSWWSSCLVYCVLFVVCLFVCSILKISDVCHSLHLSLVRNVRGERPFYVVSSSKTRNFEYFDRDSIDKTVSILYLSI